LRCTRRRIGDSVAQDRPAARNRGPISAPLHLSAIVILIFILLLLLIIIVLFRVRRGSSGASWRLISHTNRFYLRFFVFFVNLLGPGGAWPEPGLGIIGDLDRRHRRRRQDPWRIMYYRLRDRMDHGTYEREWLERYRERSAFSMP
jgi:hypothetical protein